MTHFAVCTLSKHHEPTILNMYYEHWASSSGNSGNDSHTYTHTLTNSLTRSCFIAFFFAMKRSCHTSLTQLLGHGANSKSTLKENNWIIDDKRDREYTSIIIGCTSHYVAHVTYVGNWKSSRDRGILPIENRGLLFERNRFIRGGGGGILCSRNRIWWHDGCRYVAWVTDLTAQIYIL